jgi:hypothetical protein
MPGILDWGDFGYIRKPFAPVAEEGRGAARMRETKKPQ